MISAYRLDDFSQLGTLQRVQTTENGMERPFDKQYRFWMIIFLNTDVTNYSSVQASIGRWNENSGMVQTWRRMSERCWYRSLMNSNFIFLLPWLNVLRERNTNIRALMLTVNREYTNQFTERAILFLFLPKWGFSSTSFLVLTLIRFFPPFIKESRWWPRLVADIIHVQLPAEDLSMLALASNKSFPTKKFLFFAFRERLFASGVRSRLVFVVCCH